MADLKEIIKPPFANYDVVVYFGCGLFFIPFSFHYIVQPLGLRFPHFQFDVGTAFADSAISTLSLLFAVYILGHMIAYAASFTIEQSVDIAFGKMSSAVVVSKLAPRNGQGEQIRQWVKRRVRRAFSNYSKFWLVVRIVIIVPVAPILALSYWLDTFDYFKSRIPPRVFAIIKERAARRGYGLVSLRTQWYKSVEHDVINRNGSATQRMYNYLVISGVFRSLSFIFLLCCWAECFFGLHHLITGRSIISATMSDNNLRFQYITMYVLYSFLFSFCVSAYIKFSRRYVEEALFAFALSQ